MKNEGNKGNKHKFDPTLVSRRHLKNDLKIVNGSRSKGFTKSKPEVIELDNDEDITCITLDDSVNELPCVCPDKKQNTVGTKIDHNVELTTPLNNNVSYPKNSLSSLSQLLNGKKFNTEIITLDTIQRGSKRKYPFKEDNSVVEIDDDEVIVLDDTFSIKEDTIKESSNSNILVDLTEIPTIHSSDKSCEILFSTRDQKETSVGKPIAKADSARGGESLSTCTFNPSIEALLSRTSNFLNTCGKSSSQSNISSKPDSKKTKSRLAYKRPAHLEAMKSPSNTRVDTQSNVYNPKPISTGQKGLRPIVIDGSNIGISFGKGQFSVVGVEMCINYFKKRGHQIVKAFIPHYRIKSSNYDALNNMERQGNVVFTPSRMVDRKMVAPYDDRYIVQYATEVGGIIVSKDHYRDLIEEDPRWKETIEKRLLMFTWVDDLLLFPQDPLGRNGPTLDEFLKFPDS